MQPHINKAGIQKENSAPRVSMLVITFLLVLAAGHDEALQKEKNDEALQDRTPGSMAGQSTC